MKAIIIRSVLVILFITSVYHMTLYVSLGGGTMEHFRTGVGGGAAGFGFIAGACVFSLIYFECNYKKPGQ